MSAYGELKIVGKANAPGPKATLKNALVSGVGHVLNRAGVLTYTLPTNDSKAAWTKLVKYETQYWWKDSLYWWGVPVSRRISNGQIEVTCMELWWYFYYRFIHTTLSFPNIDQVTIGWQLIDYAQQHWPGADLNIDAAAFIPSGQTRLETYPRHEHANIAQLVEGFANMVNGYDISIEVFGDGRREWTPHYPSKGVLRANTKIEWGRNIVSYEVNEDATRMANWATFTGKGEGLAKVGQSYVDVAARDEYVLMQDVQNDPDSSQLTTLLEKAKAKVNVSKAPIQLVSVTCKNTPVDLVPLLKTGDQVPIVIDDGEAQVASNHRIISKNLIPESDTLELGFNLV